MVWGFAIVGVALWLFVFLVLRGFEDVHRRIDKLQRRR